LDLFFGEHSKDNNIVSPLLKPLMGIFKSSRIDESPINLRPSRSWWNSLLACVLEWCHTFTNGVGIFGEFLFWLLQDASYGRFRLFGRGRDEFDLAWALRL
jgi:hypothetical protein